MPRARSNLEGGAPFFYWVEESQGTAYGRGGESGVQVEVGVPIVVNGVWAGLIGAADSDPDRVWRTDDLILLRTLATSSRAPLGEQAIDLEPALSATVRPSD